MKPSISKYEFVHSSEHYSLTIASTCDVLEVNNLPPRHACPSPPPETLNHTHAYFECAVHYSLSSNLNDNYKCLAAIFMGAAYTVESGYACHKPHLPSYNSYTGD